MVPTGGTDLVSTYGFHVSNLGGGGGKLGPIFSDTLSNSGHFSFSGGGGGKPRGLGGGVNLDPYFWTLYPILDIFHFRGGGVNRAG